MTFPDLKKNLLRLFNFYIKKHIRKLIYTLILSLMVAGSTAAIAWLLDPAIKKIFIEQDQTMMLVIPIAIVLAFSIKGSSLYLARVMLIQVSNSIVQAMQVQLAHTVLKSDWLTNIDTFQPICSNPDLRIWSQDRLFA